LDEAFGLAVGLWRVGLGLDVLEAELPAGAGEGLGFVAAAIVGHDAFDGDAEDLEVRDRREEEGDGAFLLLIREDVGTGDAGVVVDGDVSILPAGGLATAMAGATAGDAMANAVEAAEFLDIEVDDLAGLLALVSRSGLLRLEAGGQTEATACKDARDAGLADVELGSDVLLGAALTAQSLNGGASGERDLAWR